MQLKKSLILVLICVLATVSIVGCNKNQENVPKNNPKGEDNPENKEKVELLVSAAASLTDVLEEISELYKEKNPDVELVFTFGSSGALQSQIEEGAPVDIFISAAQKQMDDLEKGGHILEDTKTTLLINKVVLITSSDDNKDLSSFEDLTKENIKKIAVGDPSNVPVGQYSEEIFSNLNITDDISSKLVLGNDVRTVLTWVENAEVDCGIVYATDAFTSDKVEIITEAPSDSHKEVSYPAAVVKDSKHADESKAFIDFLSTDEIIKIFEKYGFTMK